MTTVRDDTLSFIVGQPSEALIPHSLISAALTRTLSCNTDPFIFQYAPAQGPVHVRHQMASFLRDSGQYPVHFDASNLCISFGNSHGLSIAIQSLTSPGDHVIVEDPTYFLIGKILRDASLVIHACPVSESDGLDMDAFEVMVKTIKPRAVYVNPVHHNPTGTCLSVARRERLLRLSIEHNFIIFSDEPYVLLSFDDPVVSEAHSSLAVTAARICPPAYKNLVCFGTFSKILTPGLRCGWISGHPDVVSRIATNGALNSGGGPSSLIVETIRGLMKSGELEEHIAFLNRELKQRRDAMSAAILSHFPQSAVSFHHPAGGYFLYLRFANLDTVMFQEYLTNTGVKIMFLPGSKCSAVESERHPCHAIRLSFSFYTPAELAEGIIQLAIAFTAFCATQTNGSCTIEKNP